MPAATRSKAAAGPSTPAKDNVSALSSASISTSEQLVKALRVPQPPANGVTKIDIAFEAWRSADFFVPKKAELLSQWALEHLCSSLKASTSASAQGTPSKGKNKAKQQQLAPSGPSELDSKPWQLLADIVSAQIGADSELSEAAKRSWLSHLANTQPVVALAGALAKQLAQEKSFSQENLETLLTSASVSLAKLLPPATSRTAATNIEEATDAIQAWLNFFSRPRSTVQVRTGHSILSSIVTTWTTTLQYGTNAKRNHQHFCVNAMPSLLRALHNLSSAEEDSTLQVVKHVAADSLFTENVQRTMLQAGRDAKVTSSPSWKETKTQPRGVVQQLASYLEDQQLDEATLSSLTTLTHLLYAKLSRSEALNSIASTSSSTSGSVRETQLALVRKTMLSEWLFPLLPFLITSVDAIRRSQRAAARKGIFSSIEQHSLDVIGCDEAEEWQSLFTALFESIKNELRQVALDALPSAQSEIADHFSALTSLWRVEKAVIEEELVSILAMAAVQPVSKEALWKQEELQPSTIAALDFFRAVAAIDVRFRTIPTLIHNILSSISAAAELHDDSLSSGLFTSQTFLAELGKLCRDSVTPMQVPDLINRFTGLSQNLGSIPGDEPKAKKQRTNTATQSKASTSASVAMIAHLQIAAQVVQSVNLAPTLRPRSIAAAEELHDRLLLPCVDASLSPSRTNTTYGIAAAALRVRQALLSEKWRYDPSEPVKLDGSLPNESLSCLESALDERADSLVEILGLTDSKAQRSDSHLCQLQFQIVQSLLQRAERDSFPDLTKSWYCQLLSTDSGAVFNLVKEVSTIRGGESEWTGCGASIRGRGELMQVVWMAVVTRWAPLFESLANPGAMSMLAATVVATADPSKQDAMQYITSSALRNASFLELPKWRKAIVTHIQEELSSTRDVKARLAATAPLWITPAEWVNRTARGALLAKLLTLDRDIDSIKSKKNTSTVDANSWTHLRTLLARVQEEYASEAEVSDDDLLASLDAFLHAEATGDAEAKHAWEQASLAAIQACVRVLLQRSKQRQATHARLVDLAKQVRREASAGKSGKITLLMRASQHMLATLASDPVQEGGVDAAKQNLEAVKSLSSSKGDVAQALDIALYHLREIHISINGAGAGVEVQELMMVLSKDVVASLCILFSQAAHALEVNSNAKLALPATEVALELVRCIEACSASNSSSETSRASGVAACLAYSALLSSMPALSEQRKAADAIQRFISRLGAKAYDSVLSALLTALRTTAANVDIDQASAVDGDAAALILTIGLILGSAPEGTSKIARSHLSSLLALLTSPSTLYHSGVIRLHSIVASVRALENLTSHHAMLLRTQDMASILQLFSTLTGPSMADTPSRTLVELPREKLDMLRSRIFTGVVVCLGSLMRLRQDLVLSLLPQLGSQLARLCTLFRRLRPNASGLHKRQLRRDLPAWLDPQLTSPLTAEVEARALSRLLSQLVAKNVSLKTRAEGGEKKAESLARPFSKHATYILVAYLRSLTEGGWVVAPEVRAELEVGMLTVCEIMGHHQRDAAMVGLLDAGGRVLLKRIWGEYEKSRYKGQ